jgi:hypothetical protein
MINLNCRIKLNDGLSVKTDNFKNILLGDDKYIILEEQETMILNHCNNFKLKEIAIILQEFFQMEYSECVNNIELFVNKLTENNAITIIDEKTELLITETDNFLINNEIELIQDDDGTGVIKDTSLGKMLYLNKTGLEIWALFTQHKSILNIISELSKKYSIDREMIKTDIMEFFSILLEKDFIIKK